MNANVEGILLVKSDRINERIKEYTNHFLNLEQVRENETISKDDFKEYVAGIHVIVTTELNSKGVERKWKRLYKKPENLNNAYSQGIMRGLMNWLKTLMMNLRRKN